MTRCTNNGNHHSLGRRPWPSYDQRPGESMRDYLARLDSYPIEPEGHFVPWTCVCESPTPGRYGECGTCLRMVEK